MEKEFIPYEQALALKELGFDEPCFGYYEPNGNLEYVESHIVKDFPYLAKNSEWQDLVAASTFSQAFRWFRDKHNLGAIVSQFGYAIENQYGQATKFEEDKNYLSYEESELECLKKLIKLIKKGNK
jgi:hypothetical protein